MLFCVKDEAKPHETILESNGKSLSNVTADNGFFFLPLLLWRFLKTEGGCICIFPIFLWIKFIIP